MPMSKKNLEAIRSGYEALNRGNYETAFQWLDPAIEWEPADQAPFAGTYYGHEGVRQLLESLLDVFDRFQWEPEEFFETDDQVVVLVRMVTRGRESSAEVETRVGHLWTMREGLAVRFQVFPDREKALEAVGLKKTH